MNRLLVLTALASLAASLAAGQMPFKMSVEAARTVVAELASHDFTKVEARFDDRMRGALPEEKLAAVWTSLEAQVGKFQQIRGAVVSGGPMRKVTLVCHFEHADLDALVTFDQSGRLASLFFRPSEAATWKPPAYAQPRRPDALAAAPLAPRTLLFRHRSRHVPQERNGSPDSPPLRRPGGGHYSRRHSFGRRNSFRPKASQPLVTEPRIAIGRPACSTSIRMTRPCWWKNGLASAIH
jgi:hypothetical protein